MKTETLAKKESTEGNFFQRFGKGFLMLFKPKCPECSSKDNTIECYSGNPYDKNGTWDTGRQCNNCTNFWFS